MAHKTKVQGWTIFSHGKPYTGPRLYIESK